MSAPSVNPSQRIVFFGILLLAALGLFIALLSSGKKENNPEAVQTETSTTPQTAQTTEQEVPLLVRSEQIENPSQAAPPEVPPLITERVEETQENVPVVQSVESPAVVVPEPLTEEFPMDLPPLAFTADVPAESDESPRLRDVEDVEDIEEKSAETVSLPPQGQTPKPENWVLFHYYYRLSLDSYGQQQWDVVLVPVQDETALVFAPVVPFFPVMPTFGYNYCYSYFAFEFFRKGTLYYPY